MSFTRSRRERRRWRWSSRGRTCSKRSVGEGRAASGNLLVRFEHSLLDTKALSQALFKCMLEARLSFILGARTRWRNQTGADGHRCTISSV